MDRRYISIGALPSNGNVSYSFKDVSVRPFELGDLTPLFTAIQQSNIYNLIKTLQHCVDVDIEQLTDGDLLYVMAWIRMFSYPKSSVIVTWKCHHTVIEDHKNKIVLDPRIKSWSNSRLKDRGYKHAKCLRKNTVPLTDVSIKQYRLPEGIQLPDGFDFPRVSTLIDFDENYDGTKQELLAKKARWVSHGTTLEEKIKWLNRYTRKNGLSILADITSFEKRYFHGVKDVIRLDCMRCDSKDSVERIPNVIKFFSVTSEESILNMQYNLASAIGLHTDSDTPSKNLMYWHSCYEKDRIEKEEQRRAQEAVRKRNR